jgi:A/G-specific adenine glycosylase
MEFLKQATRVRTNLLTWYDATYRVLAWRHVGETVQDPYPIWVSEIMLQQTTVATVGPYFDRFMRRWPTVDTLASSPLEEVLTEWQGLGYYHRAKNLHKTAHLIATTYKGQWPSDVEALQKLPGIGSYTAKAIAAIAFQQPVVPVDGNIKRVIARLHGITTPFDRIQKEVEAVLNVYARPDRPGDFAQALMDLGARVCIPKNPKCSLCPLQDDCFARQKGKSSELPLMPIKSPKPTRRTTAFLLLWSTKILLRKRPETGLLPNMMEVPTTPWVLLEEAVQELACTKAPVQGNWIKIPFIVSHVFTHFKLDVEIYGLVFQKMPAVEGIWVELDDLATKPLPTLMKKIITPSLRELKQIKPGNS